ncbi:AAA family ATPase [Leptotrichia trevisanii]|uniref:AAA family ATPase n=1 Tax=Leptotrichia trevisanii TaxID=109328 RepID=UPI0026EF634D|nr:AAA family ATPase [Leptotrichia trevisanii]
MKIRKIHIKEYNGLKNLNINFKSNDKILDTIILIGVNGSGKTRILESIYHCFKIFKSTIVDLELFYEKNENEVLESLMDSEGLTEIEKEMQKDIDYIDCLRNIKYYNEDYKEGKNQNINSKIISQSFKKLKIFPKIIYVPTEINFQKVEIASPMLVQEYSFLNIVDSILIKDVPSYIATRIMEMANEQENTPMGEIRAAVFKEINEIFEILDLDIKISGISKNAKSIPIFTNSAGDKFDINELSSGEKQLFLRTLAIKMLNPENSIILIDEPELSLHPKWQQRIVDVYRKIGKNNQIIIATHSPHILGSVKKENIMLLDKDDEGKIVIKTGDELYDSYGQPTERILEDIMGLKTTRNQEIFDKLEKIREMVNEDKYETDDFKKEYGDLKEILGTMDEDIILIDMEIQIRRKGLKNVKNK